MKRQRGHRFTRRGFLKTVGGVAASGVLAALSGGCGVVPGGSGTSGGGNEITWLQWSNPDVVGYTDLVKAFHSAQSEVKVKVMPTPDRYEDKVRTLLASGSHPDIVQINDDYVKGYKVKGLIKPLDDYIKKSNVPKDDFVDWIWNFPIHDGNSATHPGSST